MMKKRWISLLLVVLMVMTLLPLSALAAGPTKNGPAAFNLLVNAAKKGEYKDGEYSYTFKNTSQELCDIDYNPSEDKIEITCCAIKESNTIREVAHMGSITIPRDLTMPYEAYYAGIGTDGKTAYAWPDLNSSFVTSGSFYYDEWHRLGNPSKTNVYAMLVRVLDYTQMYFFNGTYYSVGDLGFTAFADNRGLAYGVTIPTGWQKQGGNWYYYNSDGVKQTGWQKISNVWYYFNTSGVMQTGWQKVGGAWYYFQSGGQMVTGWQKIGGVWYYFASGGQMQTGWRDIGGKTYYFKPSGAMAASEWCNGWWLNADGSWTYPYKGSWKQDSTGWWFGDTSGWYACNTRLKINDVYYTFNARGYMV